jgi:hypothetical protein
MQGKRDEKIGTSADAEGNFSHQGKSNRDAYRLRHRELQPKKFVGEGAG